MITLRLFHSDDPFRPLETRTFPAGEVSLGRDPGADWVIDDPGCEISRRHCVLRFCADTIVVRDESANGVFIGAERRRLGRGVETAIEPHQPIRLGQFLIVMEPNAPANDKALDAARSLDAPFHAPMLHEPELSPALFDPPTPWPAAPKHAKGLPSTNAELLEAFCEGAQLDPSLFVGADAVEVFRRAGAVYREAVIGLSDLMGERTSLRSEYDMNRTTVGATNNNPFKWVDAHQIAVDLLHTGNRPFLTEGAAIAESFRDLKKHLLCMMAGSRAALNAVFEQLAPEQIEQSAAEHAQLLQSKSDACWREMKRRHAVIMADAQENADSAINRAFKAGYERNVRRLDGVGTRS